MDEKTLTTLEYPKILERLAQYAAFSASAELIRAMRPTNDLELALQLQRRTSEARLLLSVNADVTVGGATDIRPLVDLAGRGGVLQAAELLEVKNTLMAARNMARSFERAQERYPTLTRIAEALPPPPGLIDSISRAISERGDILDSASPRLGTIRRDLKISHERLMARLSRMINDPKNQPMLQEQIITQRNGRYVIPLRAEFKGRVRSIIHDQSSSGATLFVEPLVVVDLNNQWHALQLEERDEERRILAELSGAVGKNAFDLKAMVEALAEMDLALSCAKYAEDTRASEPELVAFRNERDGKHPGSTLRLHQARHPLLDPKAVVPTDVYLDEKTFALVITGPNTGGKTVTLKTVGLLAVMAQAGLHIPAQSGATLSIFKDIYADIGDEQSIEQSLSTFSGHITNITRILTRAGRQSLVLLDELGAGTDPQEGAALARAILSFLLEKRITCLVATHYPELKTYAHGTPGVVNASMEFNLETLRPTYHLTIGLPGRSNALAIAERLGLPKEIISAARSTINPEDLRAEDLLDEIHHQRDLARKSRAQAETARGEAEKSRRELNHRLAQIEDERRLILEKARQEAEEEAADLRAELDEVRRALLRARQPLEALKPLQDQVEEIRATVERPVEREEKSGERRPLRLGDKVRLRSLRMEGVITALGEMDAEVQLGNLRVRARLDEMERPGAPTETSIAAAPPPAPANKEKSTATAGGASAMRASPGMELDLRGMRAEDALDSLDRYLENAYMAGLPFVRIIHGKGTGRLRQVIREALRQSPHVRRHEAGMDTEGGDGVTVAHLE
ncbi:MAG TPA: endonuclease MutS2 [Anaerolineaceae bacterium]